jgi:hypothetical protein
MATRQHAEPAWARWRRAWLPVFLVAASWTVLRCPLSGVIGLLAFLCFWMMLAVGVARDAGSPVRWSAVPITAAWLTAPAGPLVDVPSITLLLGLVMVATTPPVRAWFRPRRERSLAELSDRVLEARWADSDEELRSTDDPAEALALVSRRAELLDELVRRGRLPQPRS